MKIGYTQIAMFLLMVLASIWWCFIMASCSDARQAQQGYKKFINHGGKVNCKNDTIWKKDTTYLAGKMIIDSFPIPCDCAEAETPKTRYEIKWKYKYDLKRQKERDAFVIDSMNKANKLAKIKGNAKTKQVKSDNKIKGKEAKNEKRNSWGYNLRFWGVILGLLIIIVYLLKTNK